MKTKSVIYSLLYLSVTIIWGAGFLFVNDLIKIVPAFLLLFLRFSIGGVFLFAAKKIMKSKKISKQELIHGIITAAFIFFAFVLQTYGAKYTTPAKNGMLTGLYVIFVPIITLMFYRTKIKKVLFDAVICVIGMAVLFNIFNGVSSANKGDFFTVLSSIIFALHFIILEKYASKYEAINFSLIQLVCVAGISLLCSLLFESGQYAAITLTPAFYRGILFLGVLSTGYAYLMQTFVQAKINATTVSVISCLESVFAVAFSVFFNYEKITINFIIGSVIILCAMLSSIMVKNY